MSPEVIDALVRLVANGRKFRVDDAVIIEHLIEMGVPKQHAQELLTEITDGLRQGEQIAAAGSGELPTAPSASPLQVAAAIAGHHTFRVEKRRARLRAIMVLGTIVLTMLLVAWFTR